ncbi:MAG: hypothetical protein ACODAJ_17280, partial [Planctomycetota bacterium]
MSASAKGAAVAVACLVIVALMVGCAQRLDTSKDPQALVDDHMAQWKRRNPERARSWIEEEKERHSIQPPADNTHLLTGKQGEGHTYGNYTRLDLLTWRRETEKLVVEGSRIFHNAALLGGTIGVSCDMCHPDGANTHPET